MRTLNTWVIATAGALAFLAIGALEDGPDQDQIAADELKAAQIHQRQEIAQAKRELKAREAYMDHLLALDRIKEAK